MVVYWLVTDKWYEGVYLLQGSWPLPGNTLQIGVAILLARLDRLRSWAGEERMNVFSMVGGTGFEPVTPTV